MQETPAEPEFSFRKQVLSSFTPDQLRKVEQFLADETTGKILEFQSESYDEAYKHFLGQLNLISETELDANEKKISQDSLA